MNELVVRSKLRDTVQLILPGIDTRSSDIRAEFDDNLILDGSNATDAVIVKNPIDDSRIEAEVFRAAQSPYILLALLNGTSKEIGILIEGSGYPIEDYDVLYAAKVALSSFLRNRH